MPFKEPAGLHDAQLVPACSQGLLNAGGCTLPHLPELVDGKLQEAGVDAANGQHAQRDAACSTEARSGDRESSCLSRQGRRWRVMPLHRGWHVAATGHLT